MEDNFQKHTLHLDFKHNKPENMSRFIFSYLSIVQIPFKAKEKGFFKWKVFPSVIKNVLS